MSNAQRLINTIKEKDIKPTPRVWFKVREILTWAGFWGAAMLGALAFSIILFSIQQTDFFILQHLKHSRLEAFLALLPFIWIAFLTFFLVLSMYIIRRSERGYKFRLVQMAGYSFALSVLLGTTFFLAGGAQKLEQAFALRVSIYESIQEKKVQMWTMPEQGYLSGVIASVQERTLALTGFDGVSWEVTYDSAFIAPVVLLEPGEEIKLTGVITGNRLFRADSIRPWGGAGFRGRNGR